MSHSTQNITTPLLLMINRTSTGQTLAGLSLSSSEPSLAAEADDNDDVDDDDDVRLLLFFVSAKLCVSGSSTDDDNNPLLTFCDTSVPVKIMDSCHTFK